MLSSSLPFSTPASSKKAPPRLSSPPAVAAAAPANNNNKQQQQPQQEETIDWTSRLCWVHRVADADQEGSNTDTTSKRRYYLWPAVYFHGWEEATMLCTRDMTDEQKCELALNLYERPFHTSSGSDNDSDVIVARLLGTVELIEISLNTQQLGDDTAGDDLADDSSFCGDFYAWAPYAMMTCSQPEVFSNHIDWYLPFMKAIDEAFAMPRSATTSTTKEGAASAAAVACHKMLQLGQQRLEAYQNKKKKDRSAAEPSTPNETQQANRSEISTVSPASSQETPTHSNKQAEKEATTTRGLFTPSSSKTTAASEKTTTATKSTSKKPKKRSVVTVTPSRSSVRPKRKAAQKTDALTPTSTQTLSAIKFADEEARRFYNFKDLIGLLRDRLGWNYVKSSNPLKTWVYERANTKGQDGGEYLQDFFYEEDEVIDYCRNNNYKEKFGYLFEDDDDEEENEKWQERPQQTKADVKASEVSPSPNKKPRLAQ